MKTVRKNTVDYNLWNNTLCNYFFNEKYKNRTMYLYVNDDLIESLGKELQLSKEESIDDFCKSVISYARNDTSRLFEIAYIYGNRWFKQGAVGLPPFIGVLAVTVLAATKMNTDLEEGIHGNNYYRRLRNLIQLDGQGKPRDFEKCNELWEILLQWQQKNNGKYGYLNIFKFGTEYIGYPRSQCLISDNERELLYDFFFWTGLKPSESITAKQLEEQLDLYLYNKNNRLSRFFFRNELKNRESIINLVLFELEKWDGNISIVSNRTYGEQWVHKVNSYNLFLKVDIEGTLNKRVNLSLFGVLEDIESEEINYKSLDGFEIMEGAIKRNVNFSNISSDYYFELEDLRIRARFKSKGTFLLRSGLDKGINGWIEREDIQLNQNHLILTNSSYKVENWLKLNSYRYKEVKFSNQPNPWSFYVFNPEESHPRNLEFIGREIIVSKHNDKISFNGGLKIQHNEWLMEYPPLCIIECKKRSTVLLNNSPVLSVLENVVEIDLKTINIKEPGIYELSVNNKSNKCLLRNDYKNRLSFDYFNLSESVQHKEKMTIAGTYIYEDLEQLPPLIEYKGKDKAKVVSDGHPFNISVNKFVHAPPFKSGRDFKNIGLDLVHYNKGIERKIDILFEYLSIRQMGNWKVFLEAVMQIFGKENYHLNAYKIRKGLSSLGFVEFIKKPFSKSFNWRVIPPSAAIIPCETPMVYLTGGRTRSFLQDIKKQVPKNIEMKVTIPKNELEPLSFFIIDTVSNNMDILGDFLESINIKFNIGEDYFAHDLLKCLPSLSGMVHSLQIREKPTFGGDWNVESWDTSFHKWKRGNHYRLTKYKNLFGQETCFFSVNTTQFVEIEKELGKLYFAARCKPPLSIFLYADYVLKVRKEYHLPELYERVLVSCFGQCPTLEGNYRVYRNVPYDIALVVSVRLGFDLNYLKRGL
ncbi:hypothetical protein [Neobacillus niacini]|uniref:hypothetical protein n=1 Tax=Neobacillus niacini TaxID=86668 RepID=UPI0005ED6731|nr:hypothetical protein [Neobacillus niacini]